MKTETKYFGAVDYDPEDILTFSQGLYGFEEEREFLLLPFARSQGMFSLQSLSTPQLAFILMDPFALDPDYAPVLQAEELEKLDVSDSRELFFYVTCVARSPVGESTVNLRCPLAINGDNGKAMQVILEDSRYQMRHRLAEFETEEEEGEPQPC